jgi:HAD superfamily hydrolase (TIGR01549 family)
MFAESAESDEEFTPKGTLLTRARGVVFDIDGTLVDTREAHLQAWQAAFAAFGVRVPRRQQEGQFGKHSQQWARALLSPQEFEEFGQDIIARKNAEYFERLKTAVAFPGAHELLRELKASGKLIALATGATWEELGLHLEKLRASASRRTGLEEAARQPGSESLLRVDAVIYDAEVKRGKPDPEVYIIARERLGTAADQTIVVGDSIYDVLAAGSARLRCIGVETGGFDRVQLRDAGAAEVWSDIAALRQAFAGPRSVSY